LPRPRALDIEDGGKKHEFAVAADQGKSSVSKKYEQFDIHLTNIVGSPAAQSLDVIGRYLGEDPTSDLHISSILEWLDECSTHAA
jgi:hypothetical protein